MRPLSGVQQEALKGFRLLASIIVYLPTILTAALSYTVAPKLSASWQSHDRKDFMESSNFRLEIGWLWGISSALILFFHADELSALIFGNENAAQAIQWVFFVPIFSTSIASRQEDQFATGVSALADVECSTPVLKGESLGDRNGELAVCSILGELAENIIA